MSYPTTVPSSVEAAHLIVAAARRDAHQLGLAGRGRRLALAGLAVDVELLQRVALARLRAAPGGAEDPDVPAGAGHGQVVDPAVADGG